MAKVNNRMQAGVWIVMAELKSGGAMFTMTGSVILELTMVYIKVEAKSETNMRGSINLRRLEGYLRGSKGV